jgi:hypothetical protein
MAVKIDGIEFWGNDGWVKMQWCGDIGFGEYAIVSTKKDKLILLQQLLKQLLEENKN